MREGFNPPSFPPHSHRLPPRGSEHDSPVPESEDAVRTLKASESVVAAFHAVGFPAPTGDLAAIIASDVKSKTREIPVQQLRHMTPGSGLLGASASSGVNMYLASLTPAQREAAKAGVNPLDPAAMLKFNAMLANANPSVGGREAGAGTSGGRFAALRDGAGAKESNASLAQINAFGKMSGSDYATHLGFTGERAKEFAGIMNGTSGAFRKEVANYKNVMSDPNATPEQRAAAHKKAEDAARKSKNPNDSKALPKVQKMFDKEMVKPSSSAEISTGAKDRAQIVTENPAQLEAGKKVMEELRRKRAEKKAASPAT